MNHYLGILFKMFKKLFNLSYLIAINYSLNFNYRYLFNKNSSFSINYFSLCETNLFTYISINENALKL